MKTRRERLTFLRDQVIPNLPLHGATICWGGQGNTTFAGWAQDRWFSSTPRAQEEHMCGTVACLGGHAALHPVFNALGLQLHANSLGEGWIECSEEGQLTHFPSHDESLGALQRFFGLSTYESMMLFSGALPSGTIEARRDLIARCELLIGYDREVSPNGVLIL